VEWEILPTQGGGRAGRYAPYKNEMKVFIPASKTYLLNISNAVYEYLDKPEYVVVVRNMKLPNIIGIMPVGAKHPSARKVGGDDGGNVRNIAVKSALQNIWAQRPYTVVFDCECDGDTVFFDITKPSQI